MPASHPVSRRWFRRATSLFEAIQRRQSGRRPRRTILGTSLPLEVRIVPHIAAPGSFALNGCGLDIIGPNFGSGLGASGALGANTNAPNQMSEGPVRYADGVVKFSTTDLFSDGFGDPWMQTRSWTNDDGITAGNFGGNGWVDVQFPTLYQVGGSSALLLVSNGTNVRRFDPGSGSSFVERFGGLNALAYDSTNDDYVLTTPSGLRYTFESFDSSHPAGRRGELIARTDAYGNSVTITRDATSGKVTEVVRGGSANGSNATESWVYAYVASGTNAGLLESVTLRRKVGAGSYATVRKVVYDYYGSGGPHGGAGDLKSAVIKDASDNVLGTESYRYYTEDDVENNVAGAYAGGLKYYFSQTAFARADGDGHNPLTANDGDVEPYASIFFKYDSSYRVTEERVQGNGCSACSAGIGTYTFSYATPSSNSGANAWKYKTTETLPDGNQNVAYTNDAGQIIVKALTAGTATWIEYYQYDSSNRCVLAARPSAVTGYSESYPSLIDNDGGDLEFLNSTGSIATYDYYSTTSLNDGLGTVAGYWAGYDLQRGESGTPVRQLDLLYYVYSNGGTTNHLLGTQTVYGDDAGSDDRTTSYAYTFFSGTASVQSVATTYPVVATSQNGPGTADTETVYGDRFGRPIWTKDGGDFLTYTAYDDGTGAVTKVIVDVDSTQTSTFAAKPSGWTTPAGGGLHLTTQYEVDGLGRTTQRTTPAGDIFYTVYKDPKHEVRDYDGWNAGTATPTGPTRVVRDDRARGYTEVLTMSATPATSSGRPTGTESVASLQSLARRYTNVAGQVVAADDYFNFSGLTYSTDADIGTLNTHYFRTAYAYAQRGWRNKTVSPTLTITRTEYDARGLVTSVWVGTDDVPTSGFWSVTNTAGTDMTKVSSSVYDGGDDGGDGNPTTYTEYPNGASGVRVTERDYDWRNRLVATKQGVETSESTDLNRPIWYAEYDNLNQVVARERYDGDAVTVSDGTGDGVPDRPSSSLLRAKTTFQYDDRGRLHHENVWGVNIATGAVSSGSLNTQSWYDRRGQVIKTAVPGGLVTKTTYDGAGRPTTVYTSDGGGDYDAWSAADDVAGDTVLEQLEYAYDADGNVLTATTRQRFHDQTGTGALGTYNSGVFARVSFVGYYYDAADRLTASVDVGTHPVSGVPTAWTRPGSVPSRSDAALVTSRAYDAAGRLQSVTDPLALVTRYAYDALGRLTETVENDTGGAITATANKTTQFTYDGSNHLLTYTLLLPSSAYQETAYVYGASPAQGSAIASNDLLAEVRHPNKTTGAASASEKDVYAYFATGDAAGYFDRNGTLHHYLYDAVGRRIKDFSYPNGYQIDDAVRRLETAYDGQGNAFQFTSYDAHTGGNVVNQVRREFNGWGQMTREYQEHAGAVNTSTSASVGYSYSEMPSGAMHSRPTGVDYPTATDLVYEYATGIDSNVSRLTDIERTGEGDVLTLAYLGLSTVVTRANPATALSFVQTSSGDAGDQYAGLDRFGRVVDLKWSTVGGTPTVRDEFLYGYDRDSNRLWRDNGVNAAFGELYAYDALNQLTAMQRGDLDSSHTIPGTVYRDQSWSADAAGNFTTVTTDGVGQSRTHNAQNQMTALGSATPVYDYAGNLTGDGTWTYTYDSWNRLVQATDGTTTVAYAYDALGRRVSETVGGTTTHLYYNQSWQAIEERVGGTAASNLRAQYVWSPVGSDVLVYRDRDTNADGTLDERLYVQQDAQGNVTALVNASGSVVERYAYDAYGKATALNPTTWVALSGTQYDWRYLHQGLRYDAADSLYDNRARAYSAEYMRFLQEDPSGFAAGDPNTQRYVANNPIINVDPIGLQSPAPPGAPPRPGVTVPVPPQVPMPGTPGTPSKPETPSSWEIPIPWWILRPTPVGVAFWFCSAFGDFETPPGRRLRPKPLGRERPKPKTDPKPWADPKPRPVPDRPPPIEDRKPKYECTIKARNWEVGTPCYGRIFTGRGLTKEDAETLARTACYDAQCHKPGQGGDCGHVTCRELP